MLRLKPYTRFIYLRFLGWAHEPQPDYEQSDKGRRLRTSYAMTAQTVLFMNQSSDAETPVQWAAEYPTSYQSKLGRCLSLLEDSTRWAISAIALGEESPEQFPEKHLFDLDLTKLKVREVKTDTDIITTRYAQTCGLVHDLCPQNTRLKESLDRLIWSYLAAKELTYQAKELALCDRLEYLRKITNYRG